jgi:hypothetical protein
MFPHPEIDCLIEDRNSSLRGEANDIRSPTELWAHDIRPVEAYQSRDKEVIHFVLQTNGMGDQQFHGKATVLKIDNLPSFSQSVGNDHPPAQLFEKNFPERKIPVKH